MQPQPHILIVEDDPNLRFLLEEYLLMSGFEVTVCQDGQQGLRVAREFRFDLCILDVMMPLIDGYCLAKQIKKYWPRVPIVFLSARSLTEDKLNGFRAGADDYVSKPFDEEELVFRIKAILQRTNLEEPIPVPTNFQLGNIFFDPTHRTLSINGDSKRITERETEVLHMLCMNKNTVLRREDALLKIWGNNDYFLGRSLDVFIAKLRKYLKDEPGIRIDNVFGVGFMLVDEEAA